MFQKALWSALDGGEWLYTAGVAKVLLSALDAVEWPYTVGTAKSVSISKKM